MTLALLGVQRRITEVISVDGKSIRCDGTGCQAVTAQPVALRSQLMPSHLRRPAAEGWLFITGNGPGRHFCPRCAAMQLGSLIDQQREKRL